MTRERLLLACVRLRGPQAYEKAWLIAAEKRKKIRS